MGLDWVEEHLKDLQDPEGLPDLFISAGFDMFFDKKMIGRYRDEGVFKDLTGIQKDNPLFAGVGASGSGGDLFHDRCCTAVFLINLEELGDRPLPKSWSDILSPDFEKSVSLPVGDFDLFNAILLNIWKRYGDDGVQKLGRSLLESMHPSEMVTSGRKQAARPVVTIMPYFFTKMAR